MPGFAGAVRSAPFPITRVVVFVSIVVMALLGAAPANAAITRHDFPSTGAVKSAMHGKGDWDRGLSRARPLGATPALCRSDRPFAGARDFRGASYFGGIRGSNRYAGHVGVDVYEFGSPRLAQLAMGRLTAFLRDCATSTEWWCEQCDGVADITRQVASRPRNVGQQALAWNETHRGMGVSSGRNIAARSGRVVVVTSVAHTGDPATMAAPPRPTWKQAEKVARHAVRRAR